MAKDTAHYEIELPHPEDVVMMDLEASSLKGAMGGQHETGLSYPVEVGIAGADGYKEARLIKPQPDWTNWNGEPGNPDKGRIHGISRRELIENGQDVKVIAQWLNEQLTGKTVMCDSPDAKADTFWLDRLYEAAGVERTFDLQFLYDYMNLDDPDMYLAYDNTGLAREAPHRAGEDAEDLMILYREYYALKQGALEHRPDGLDM